MSVVLRLGNLMSFQDLDTSYDLVMLMTWSSFLGQYCLCVAVIGVRYFTRQWEYTLEESPWYFAYRDTASHIYFKCQSGYMGIISMQCIFSVGFFHFTNI